MYRNFLNIYIYEYVLNLRVGFFDNAVGKRIVFGVIVEILLSFFSELYTKRYELEALYN